MQPFAQLGPLSRYRHIQAITTFDTGRSDEAICHVNDLVDRSPDVQQLCAFVQASGFILVWMLSLASRSRQGCMQSLQKMP